MQRIQQIVTDEHRPVSCFDLLPSFRIEGKEYHMEYGTLRNILSRLRRARQIQIDYKTKQTFYTLPGITFGRSKMMLMTPYHMGVSASADNGSIYRLIQNLPLCKKALHDIHLRFKVRWIWSVLSANSTFKIDPVSKDIRLPVWQISDLILRTKIHRTDTVSVAVGGSYNPVAVDFNGIIRLSNALTVVEERLSKIMDDSSKLQQKVVTSFVPDHMGWIVTMWHFGIDGVTEYTGEKFSCTWEVAQNALIRAYTKDFKNGKTRIRLERQEYPSSSLAEALEEKLNSSTRIE
jgi:hypothetical protein